MNEWMRGTLQKQKKISRKIFFLTLKINFWCGVHHVLCNILVFIQAAGTIIKAIVAQRLHQAPHLPSSFIQGSVPKLSIFELLNEIWVRMRDSVDRALLLSRLYLEKVIRCCLVSWDENVAVWLETIRLTGNPWELVGLEWHWSYHWGEFLWSPWYVHVIFCA